MTLLYPGDKKGGQVILELSFRDAFQMPAPAPVMGMGEGIQAKLPRFIRPRNHPRLVATLAIDGFGTDDMTWVQVPDQRTLAYQCSWIPYRSIDFRIGVSGKGRLEFGAERILFFDDGMASVCLEVRTTCDFRDRGSKGYYGEVVLHQWHDAPTEWYRFNASGERVTFPIRLGPLVGSFDVEDHDPHGES